MIGSYTPDLNFSGGQDLTFYANDGTSDSNQSSLNIQVAAVDDTPVAADHTENINEDSKKMVLTNNIGEILKNKFDVILFDSGELISNVEFMKLFNNIVTGGFVCLHDIYYPKSFKNWLPCTVYQLRNDYKQVYIDAETSQGMYIAQYIG